MKFNFFFFFLDECAKHLGTGRQLFVISLICICTWPLIAIQIVMLMLYYFSGEGLENVCLSHHKTVDSDDVLQAVLTCLQNNNK